MTRREFEDLLTEEFGVPFVISYFERSGFTDGDKPTLYPWSYVAEGKFKQEAKKFLAHHGVKLGAPLLQHLKNPMQRAA